MRFSFDRPTIRLYRFYFLGISKPITIQAYNKMEARRGLSTIHERLAKEYQESRVIGETVEVPVFGVTIREAGDKLMVWVGKGYNSNGWMEKSEFDKKML